ncbi:dihydroxyacetone kinase subunit DhaK [Ureibacillus sp. GCM10028918]|uniref:dihydroxyacetone kinase subunit DhaK n=1 Tax=Ureibacillus sp. GCM10028918 TaxID=3273429 RepID=UPI00361C7437
MKKFMNSAENFEKEMLEGILYSSSSYITSVREDNKSIVRQNNTEKKVGILTGGGSGHLPLFLGYVGEGLLDGVAVGDIFQSPSPKQIFEVIKSINTGKGVLSIIGNYGGDVMNFELANEMADFEDIENETIIVNDDVASNTKDNKEGRRGVAGLFFVYKTSGAAAKQGYDLQQVKNIALKTNENVRSMGVGLAPCTIPIKGKPSFEISDGQMELGIGIHGEPGTYRGPQKPAKEIVEEILQSIFNDLELAAGEEIAVLVNGLGATALEELYIVYKHVFEYSQGKNVSIYRNYIGEYATSMEMVGFSISVLRLDSELKNLIDEPHNTPFVRQF